MPPQTAKEINPKPHLEVRLLGGFGLWVDGAPVETVKSQKLQALVAYLLLHRSAPQSRQHLAFLFWPDSSEEQAQSNLRNLLVALRRAFPQVDGYLLADRSTLRWRDNLPFSLDVSDFEQALAAARANAFAHTSDQRPGDEGAGADAASVGRIFALRQAVDLYSGDLLPGCYDEWIEVHRERLRQSFLDTVQQLVYELEAAGDLDSAIVYARRLLRHDPIREDHYRKLMCLYVANNEATAALNVYRQCETFLKREMAVEPAPGTRQIADEARAMLGQPATSGAAAREYDRATGASGRAEPQHTAAGNLPAMTSAFVGREREVDLVCDLLRAHYIRLLTLTGTPGVGKTRLALEAATILVSSPLTSPGLFPDGAYFVSLAPLTEPRLVATSIAQALGMQNSSKRSARDALTEHLRDKRLLLVLDNFEHLLPGAPLVAHLLSACPHLKVLATSRSTLNLSGEHEHAVPSMLVPAPDAPVQPDELMQYEAVTLFVERATEVAPDFALTWRNARFVAEICRRLDGLPLAIELAAARVKVLSPEEILARLERRLHLLVGGKSDLPSRQRTLEAAIAWSYNLLDDAEQAAFRKMGVFSGAFSMVAAQAVAGEQGEPHGEAVFLDLVAALVNKSLLKRIEPDSSGRARFLMLETLREYALQKLREAGEETETNRRHALYFMQMAEEAEPHLERQDVVEWLLRLSDTYGNIRAALRWARLSASDVGRPVSARQEAAEIGLRMAGALRRYWMRTGLVSEGRRLVNEALEVAASTKGVEPRFVPKALSSAASLAYQQDDYSVSHRFYAEALDIYRRIGDRKGEGWMLTSLAIVAKTQGNYLGARPLAERALALAREENDLEGLANASACMGMLAESEHDYETAELHYLENLSIGRQLGLHPSIPLSKLGGVAQVRGQLDVARSYFEQALAAEGEHGYTALIAEVLGYLADIACDQGDLASAEPLYRRSLATRIEVGDRYGIAASLMGLGQVLLKQADDLSRDEGDRRDMASKGTTLISAAASVVRAIGAGLSPHQTAVLEQGEALARTLLPDADFVRVWVEGGRLAIDAAIRLASSSPMYVADGLPELRSYSLATPEAQQS